MSILDVCPRTAFKIPLWRHSTTGASVEHPTREQIEQWEVLPYLDHPANCSITMQPIGPENPPFYYFGSQPTADGLHGYSRDGLKGWLALGKTTDPETRAYWGPVGGQIRRIYTEPFDPDMPAEWEDRPGAVAPPAPVPPAPAPALPAPLVRRRFEEVVLPVQQPEGAVMAWLRERLRITWQAQYEESQLTDLNLQNMELLTTPMDTAEHERFYELARMPYPGWGLAPVQYVVEILRRTLAAMCFVLTETHDRYQVSLEGGGQVSNGTFAFANIGPRIGLVFTRNGPAPPWPYSCAVEELAEIALCHLPYWRDFNLPNLDVLLRGGGERQRDFMILCSLPREHRPIQACEQLWTFLLQLLAQRGVAVEDQGMGQIHFLRTGIVIRILTLLTHMGYMYVPPQGEEERRRRTSLEAGLDQMRTDVDTVSQALQGWRDYHLAHLEWLVTGRGERGSGFQPLIRPPPGMLWIEILRGGRKLLRSIFERRNGSISVEQNGIVVRITRRAGEPVNVTFNFVRENGMLGLVPPPY